ncbi:hypothetical protein [Agromyces sp. ZXT2-3]|uniref:hypothetical protein n=1 Tax=Agromyces sp. ZXT2-3 TaxID=3461152 RepID=UPI0040552AAA
MLHLGIGRPHAGTDVIVLIHNTEATVIDPDGTILSEHRIDPERTYQPATKNG